LSESDWKRGLQAAEILGPSPMGDDERPIFRDDRDYLCSLALAMRDARFVEAVERLDLLHSHVYSVGKALAVAASWVAIEPKQFALQIRHILKGALAQVPQAIDEVTKEAAIFDRFRQAERVLDMAIKRTKKKGKGSDPFAEVRTLQKEIAEAIEGHVQRGLLLAYLRGEKKPPTPKVSTHQWMAALLIAPEIGLEPSTFIRRYLHSSRPGEKTRGSPS